LGGVDYGADPAATPEKKPLKSFPGSKPRSVEQSWRGDFKKLEATDGEIATVERRYRDLFGDKGITVLKGAAANEAAVREQAPRHLFLHLATHGFFAPPKLKSALAVDPKDAEHARSSAASGESIDVAGFHPGLLSGVVLAGANRPPRGDGDDGILTAEEVALLNLSGCRMCVLSACETGLGEVAGGEGLLGLQRAFQVAGARSTVTSLWKVDDTATRSLMERFYKNLWERELPAIEALREAQIWMLRDQTNRGLAVSDQPAGDHLPPYYWAAFVLSGDWR
jgi:CHAT domain-containing protein